MRKVKFWNRILTLLILLVVLTIIICISYIINELDMWESLKTLF